jgi:hypothetical protein
MLDEMKKFEHVLSFCLNTSDVISNSIILIPKHVVVVCVVSKPCSLLCRKYCV